MNWKDHHTWPYWLKGGVIGFAIPLILYLFFMLLFIIFGILLRGSMSEYQGYAFIETISTIAWNSLYPLSLAFIPSIGFGILITYLYKKYNLDLSEQEPEHTYESLNSPEMIASKPTNIKPKPKRNPRFLKNNQLKNAKVQLRSHK